MNDLKKKMIRQAQKQYQQIYPCMTKKFLGDCFTVEENQILFWFNTKDDSTHVLSRDIV